MDRIPAKKERIQMTGIIPIMCAAGLSLLYSGQVTSQNQLQIGFERSFPAEVPNNGFLLAARPEIWEFGIRIESNESFMASGGLLWFTQSGPARWRKGQEITVRISACQDDGMLSALQTWNALAPTQ